MRIGDVSRHRRFADPARRQWYAYHRAVRFAMRMIGQDATPAAPIGAVGQMIYPHVQDLRAIPPPVAMDRA